MTHPYDLRISKTIAQSIRELPAPVRDELRAALLRAQEDPYSWPQADRYDLDETVRVITTGTVIAHYAIVPTTPHLWMFAITAL